MNINALVAAAWDALATDHEPWGFVQGVASGLLVFAIDERVAEQVLAWELAGQVVP